MMNAKSVFISYTSTNVDSADAVYQYLQRNGISCWMAPYSISPGKDYPTEIVEGIKNCKAFVLIASKEVNESNHVSNELAIAFDCEKPIIAFKIEDVKFSSGFLYFLGRKHWIDAYHDFDEGLERLRFTLMTTLGETAKEKRVPLYNAPKPQSPFSAPAPQAPQPFFAQEPAFPTATISRKDITAYLKRLSKKFAYSLADRIDSEEEYARFVREANELFKEIISGYHKDDLLPEDTDYVQLLIDVLSGKAGNVIRVQGLPGAAKNMLLQLAFFKMLDRFEKHESDVLPIYLSVGYYEKFDYQNVETEMKQLIFNDTAEFFRFVQAHSEVKPVLLLEGVREYVVTRYAPEKCIFTLFQPFGQYNRAITIDTGLIQNRIKLKKVIPIAGEARGGYLLLFNSIPMEQENRVKNAIKRVLNMYGEEVDCDMVYALLKKLKYSAADVFLIRLVAREILTSYDTNISLSDMYEKFVLTEYLEEERLLQVSRALFEYLFSGGDGCINGEYDGKIWSFPNKHHTYLGYLIAYYFVYQIENYKTLQNYDFFKVMLTSTANQFVVAMLQDNYELQEKFIDFIDNKFEVFDVRQKSNAAYWLGRINYSKEMVNYALSFLTGEFTKLKALVKTNNKNTQENLDNHLLFRSVCTGMLFHGQANMMDEYLCIVLTNDIANAVNRGATVEYFSEQYQMGAHNTYYLDTNPNFGESAIKALAARVEASLHYNKDKFVENNLVTLLTLLQTRIQSKVIKPNFDIVAYVKNAVHYLELYQQKPHNIVSSKILYYFDSVKEDFLQFLADGGLDIGPMLYNKCKVLKYVKRSQWAEKVEAAESVSEHMFSSWLLAMLLLPEEMTADGYNKKEILDMLLIHDMAQIHKIPEEAQNVSVDIDAAEQNDFMRKFFLKGTYPNIANLTYYYNVWTGYYNGNNINAKIAHDINLLQAIYTFFEYYSVGKYEFSKDEAAAWKDKKNEMKTQIGLELFERMIENNFEFKNIIEQI